ncbi:MAG: Sec-independent protein translocase subunit TatA/TatB [Actinomycetota bacterium]
MGNFGPAEMLVIGVFALLVFGPQKLPEIARSIGRAVKEFKKYSNELNKELKLSLDDESKVRTAPPAKPPASPGEPQQQIKPGPKPE